MEWYVKFIAGMVIGSALGITVGFIIDEYLTRRNLIRKIRSTKKVISLDSEGGNL